MYDIDFDSFVKKEFNINDITDKMQSKIVNSFKLKSVNSQNHTLYKYLEKTNYIYSGIDSQAAGWNIKIRGELLYLNRYRMGDAIKLVFFVQYKG